MCLVRYLLTHAHASHLESEKGEASDDDSERDVYRVVLARGDGAGTHGQQKQPPAELD